MSVSPASWECARVRRFSGASARSQSLSDIPDDGHPSSSRARGSNTIDATFRNGSLTAISVVVGFSLSFLNRWAAVPGPWQPSDLGAITAIVLGIPC